MRDKFVFNETISHIDWSPDDSFIMSVMGKKN